MILFVNQNNEVKDVDHTDDTTLMPLYVDETNEMFPFKNKSVAFICCYRVIVSDGIVTMMTPYVDSRLIEHIDQLGKENIKQDNGISENSDAVLDVADLADENNMAITDLADYAASLEERIAELEGK